MLVVSISIYAVDTFTAINLLAFDRWAGQIEPSIPFSISRWIFAGCIILSFVLLIYRMWRAIRVIKQGGVAKSYLDPLAVRLQSIRMGERGRGFKRFLVFAELTKSRKGADYVALFAYFSFEAWLRIVFAEGPRAVVNGITLYSVTRLNLVPVGEHAAPEGHSPVAQFFVNIGVMADKDRLQAVILFGMLWTCFIWILEAISLALSVILYLLFLWHHIPSGDGGLSGYCRKKINRRMERIVKVKVDTALKQENELRAREDAKAARQGIGITKKPTLPSLDSADTLAPLSRTTTMTTLPEYVSRPGTGRLSDESLGRVPPMPDLQGRPPGPHRVMTHQSEVSVSSFSSNAPLMGAAGDMGYAPTPGATPGSWDGRPGPPGRSMTGQYSQRSFSPGPPHMNQSGRHTPGSYPMEPIPRPGTGMSGHLPRRPSDNDNGFGYAPDRTRTPSMERGYDAGGRRTPANNSNPYFPAIPEGRNSPAFGGPPRSQSRGPPGGPMMNGPGPILARMPTGGSEIFGRSPPERSFTPVGEPTLPRLPSTGPSPSPGPGDGGYRAFTPGARSMTPQGGPPPNPYGRPPPSSGYPPRGPPGRQNSGPVDDILNHY
jgi:hypothetical protein